MRIDIEVLGHVISLSLSVEPVEEEVLDPGGRLDAHIAFGFSPDPVFPELDWGEEEEVCKP